MARIAVVTDSNSGMTPQDAAQYGVTVLPMPFYIDGELYFEGITLTQEQFYACLERDAEISTSQPVPGDVTGLWDKLLKDYDEVVYIPMSSGLSASCETATLLSQAYGGRVHVVNNQRISVTLRQSVLDAVELAGRGYSGKQIREILESVKFESSIYICLETLKYLKKGGRVTPSAAAIGSVLNIKPVLTIQGERLDSYAKTRGKKNARRTMIAAIRKDLEERFSKEWAEGRVHMAASYAGNPEEAEDWLKELEAAFPGKEFHMDPLSLSIACHIGYGALAVTCTAFLPDKLPAPQFLPEV